MFRGLLFFGATLLGAIAGLIDPAEALAATFTVNSGADESDFAPGNGVCRTTQIGLGPGNCTLRAAIQEANARPGPDTIFLTGGIFSMFANPDKPLDPGPEPITDDLVIQNLLPRFNSIVDLGNPTGIAGFNEWQVAAGKTVRFVGFTARRGRGMLVNPGATLFLTSMQVEQHFGEVRNFGTLNVSNSAFVNGNDLSVRNERGGVLNLDTSRFEGNQSTGGGGTGGIIAEATSTSIITNSLFANNVATGQVSAGAMVSRGALIMANTTISGNSGLDAGGLKIVGGAYQLLNVTIANNTGPGVFVVVGAGAAGNFQNTLFANNTPNCVGAVQFNPDITKQQNLSTDATCPFPPGTNLVVGNPFIEPLGDNGGPTRTHALRPGSPAIDAAFCVGFAPVTLDQRGSARPIDGNSDGVALCDIGAFERAGGTGFGGVGVGTLSPRDATAGTNQPFTQVLNWDVPGPESWNALSTVDYRLRADGKIIFWVRWYQTTNLFQLLGADGNPQTEPILGGAPVQIGNEAVLLDISGLEGRGTGATGLRAILTLRLIFADSLQGKLLTVEVAGSNDFGASDVFRAAGTIKIDDGQVYTGNNDGKGDKVDKDEKEKETEDEKRQRQVTNRGNRDEYHLQGTVKSWGPGPWEDTLLVDVLTIPAGSPPVTVLIFCKGGKCPEVHENWEISVDGLQHGQKDGDNWFWADEGWEIGPPRR